MFQPLLRRYLGRKYSKSWPPFPMLETLKMNKAVVFGSRDWEEGRIYNNTAIAIAIGENMRELKHLELFENNMLNDGLKAILDGCPHIESLDLRQCKYINLKGDLGERCSQQITYLKLPNDFVDSTSYDVTTDYYSYNDEYDNDDDDD
nr:hypothetical protein [Tanacetum cinerariifolium]